jgi:hypothetical protein
MLRFAVLAALVAAFLCAPAVVRSSLAHGPYDEYVQMWPPADTSPYSDKKTPTGGLCCGGTDCAPLLIEPGVLSAEEDGYRVTLTLEQARKINPYVTRGTSFVVPWDQVQPSWDTRFHLCIPNEPRGEAYAPPRMFYCFFAPPNT